jgi:hypothetical protein
MVKASGLQRPKRGTIGKSASRRDYPKSTTEFAADSPLEGDGFEPSVPLPRKALLGLSPTYTDPPKDGKRIQNPWSLRPHSPAEEKSLVCLSTSSPRLDLHDPWGRPVAELADRYQRCGVSLNSFVPGGVGTSKTLSVTETNE